MGKNNPEKPPEKNQARPDYLLFSGDIPTDMLARAAVSYLCKGRYNDALLVLVGAKTLSPKDPMIAYYMGITQMALRHPTKARQSFARAITYGGLQPPAAQIEFRACLAATDIWRHQEGEITEKTAKNHLRATFLAVAANKPIPHKKIEKIMKSDKTPAELKKLIKKALECHALPYMKH